MPAVSLLVLAVLTQPVQHRVEVLGRGGEAFWSAGARGNDLWERVRGEVRLEARRNSEGASSAEVASRSRSIDRNERSRSSSADTT